MIPSANPEAIREALRRFDEQRDTGEWKDWEKNGAYKYAIENGGRRYPVKHIISMATGASRRTFSGGSEANSYLASRGFTVSPIRDENDNKIQSGLDKILGAYLQIRRSKPFGQDPELWPAFESICDSLRKLPSIASRPTLSVVWSAGRGNWARVPWISILDSRETSSTQEGVYCVFLFREDLSGVYLTFNQGVTEPKKRGGPSGGLDEVKKKAVELRAICGPLVESGFKLDDSIDLHVEGGLGRDYEFSTIAYKAYEKGRVPIDEDIADDVDAVVEIYDRYLTKGADDVQPPESEKTVSQETPAPKESEGLNGLLSFLEQQGLHFSEELVANYLLALRTKRFVILSGLSGTGKTQLALGVAKFFESRVSSYEIVNPYDARVLISRPYMFEHNQIILPRDFVHYWNPGPPREGTQGSSNIHVSYPQGREALSFWHDSNFGSNRLLLRGPIRDWFKANLRPGDEFLLRAISSDPDKPDELEISLPKSETVSVSITLKNRRVVAVRPDWTDSRGLLGYFNPLTKSYVIEPALELLLSATRETELALKENRAPHPFFLILDEMNLAHVEQYFSDFLSCLESGEPLALHREIDIESGANEEDIAVPRELAIPGNVYFTGTVNVDETTYMFSPKVLDRAFTIELQSVDLAHFGRADQRTDVREGALKLTSIPLLEGSRKPDVSDWRAFEQLAGGQLRASLIALNDLLAPFSLHFGYRVANEIGCFVTLAAGHTDGGLESIWAAMDLAILQKILPKFHGTQEELDEPLRMLFRFTLSANGDFPLDSWQEIREAWKPREEYLVPQAGGSEPRLPRTAAKVWLMLQTLHRQGFTSFIS